MHGVNAQDIYHKLQVDDCGSLGPEASRGIFEFFRGRGKAEANLVGLAGPFQSLPSGWERTGVGKDGRGPGALLPIWIVTEEAKDQAQVKSDSAR